jgi:protein-S-isoprenylcysteine O-methyltransferase Ste14
MWTMSRIQLGSNLTFSPSSGVALVTTGIYAYFRHPIYYFGTIGLASYIMLIQQYYLFWLFIVLIPMQILRALREHMVLRKKYQEQYEEYERKVWL